VRRSSLQDLSCVCLSSVDYSSSNVSGNSNLKDRFYIPTPTVVARIVEEPIRLCLWYRLYTLLSTKCPHVVHVVQSRMEHKHESQSKPFDNTVSAPHPRSPVPPHESPAAQRKRKLLTLLLGHTDSATAATGRLGVLTAHAETPVVSQTTVGTDLLEALEIFTELAVDAVGQDLGVLAIDDVALPVEEPGRDFVCDGQYLPLNI
jgi:hypothetical protein